MFLEGHVSACRVREPKKRQVSWGETGTGEGSCLPGQLWGWGGDQDMGKALALSTTQIPGGQKVVSLLEVGKQAQRLSNLPKVTQLLLCIVRM